MKSVVEFLRRVVAPPERPKPPDLRAFEAARKRLVQKTTAVSREADRFAAMVSDMQGRPVKSRKRKTNTKS